MCADMEEHGPRESYLVFPLGCRGVFGVLTWYLDKFSHREELVRISALSGIVSMLSLVLWTWTDL